MCQWPASLGHLQHRVGLPHLDSLVVVMVVVVVVPPCYLPASKLQMWYCTHLLDACHRMCKWLHVLFQIHWPRPWPAASIHRISSECTCVCDVCCTGFLTVMASPAMAVKFRLLPTPSFNASQAEGSLWLAVHQGVWLLVAQQVAMS
jgi:hypothetical protein